MEKSSSNYLAIGMSIVWFSDSTRLLCKAMLCKAIIREFPLSRMVSPKVCINYFFVRLDLLTSGLNTTLHMFDS